MIAVDTNILVYAHREEYRQKAPPPILQFFSMVHEPIRTFTVMPLKTGIQKGRMHAPFV